jgi:glyceraldehyde 3-phosphate dehydrogenase
MNEKQIEAKENHYKESLNKWIEDEKLGFEFVDMLGKLFYEKSIELILFRSQLLDRSSSVILFI